MGHDRHTNLSLELLDSFHLHMLIEKHFHSHILHPKTRQRTYPFVKLSISNNKNLKHLDRRESAQSAGPLLAAKASLA
jgi:hypothetical protein